MRSTSRTTTLVGLLTVASLSVGCPNDNTGGTDVVIIPDDADSGETIGADVPDGDTTEPADAADADVDEAPVGLDERPENATCTAPDRPPTDATIELQQVFSNLQFVQPVWMQQAPGPDDSWYVIEQPGRIKTFANDPQTAQSSTWIDITDRVRDGGERGLLGMAFHPDWPNTSKVYLSYTTNEPGPLTSRISEFSTTANGQKLDPASEDVIFSLEQPFGNHNGGQISFGPDGYLYAGFGDGGSANDPQGNGQNPNTLLGAMLRIDPTGGDPYAIPSDNPFADGNNGKPEIFAWGLRNPWRFSFDQQTGELWVGDVGQNAWEEVSIVERGGNYGWNAKEGTHCFAQDPCDEGPWIDPVAEYDHDAGKSITGGYVYHGDQVPSLRGIYLYADFVTGRIWGLFYDDETGEPSPRELLETSHRISSFAQAKSGEMYILDYTGSIHAIRQPANNGAENTFPQKLSETGCVDPQDPTRPADGLVGYRVNAPFWSDGAQKERYIALPQGETIDTTDDTDTGWTLPVGSVVVKSFKLEGEYVETRLLVRHDDGGWAGYSYDWNDEQTDATLLKSGRVEDRGDQQWVFPSRAECQECHTQAAGHTLGLKTAQLNGSRRYRQTGRTSNQIATLDHIGIFADSPFSNPASPDPSALPRMPSPFGSASLDERARAYLHTNCSQCHRSGVAMRPDFDLQWETPLAERGVCDTDPVTGDLGVGDAKLVAPGQPDRSLLKLRADRRDANGMPPLGSRIVDSQGVGLLENWISSRNQCP